MVPFPFSGYISSEQSCLRCHSTPAAAPKSQIATYGSENGFGWKLNEIIGAQVIYVPATEVINSAHRSFLLFMAIVAAAFALAILITNILLRVAVLRPINRMVKVANEVSTGNMDAEFEQNSNDEIGTLAAAFKRMKISLSVAMNMLNQRRG
ncbi:c-type heme family protein [Argonema antarcticum]|uniref:c-type heme family protein n=1 Tax=Argonema antarcticum TaxID=2942763 RepID=UPI0030840AC1